MRSAIWTQSGLGDWLQVDSILTPEERQTIDTIYWSSTAEPALRPVLESSPYWRHVKHVTLFQQTDHHFYQWSQVDYEIKLLNLQNYQALLDRRPVGKSTLLKYKLTDLPPDLPTDYIVIHPSTPVNPSEFRAIRDMRPHEWKSVFRRLEKENITGLVLNSGNAEPAPRHPNLIDLSGKTTFPQAVEIVKHCKGYIGIDSWMSILAAQLLPSTKMDVRCGNEFLVRNPWYFYNYDDWSFLVPELGKAPYQVGKRPTLTEDDRYLQVLRPQELRHSTLQIGHVVSVPRATLDKAVRAGDGREVFGDEADRFCESDTKYPHMKVQLCTIWSTALGSYQPGQVAEVPTPIAHQLVDGGFGIALEPFPVEEVKTTPKRKRATRTRDTAEFAKVGG